MTRSNASLLRSLLLGLSVLPVAVACGEDHDATALRGGERAPAAAPGGEQTPPGTPTAEGPKPAFVYGAEVQLLPFDVRMAKVAHVAGVGIEDPILDVMRARRLELGDHDYAKGQKPDLGWTSTRIGTWIRAIKPVCDAPIFKTKYPSFPESLDALVVAAYGRHATEQDQADIAATVGASGLAAPAQYRLVCLTVLTSLEFVAR